VSDFAILSKWQAALGYLPGERIGCFTSGLDRRRVGAHQCFRVRAQSPNLARLQSKERHRTFGIQAESWKTLIARDGSVWHGETYARQNLRDA
jgi:hypothetical protein